MTTIKGFRRMTGISKKTGKKYDGFMLYCEEDETPDDTFGNICFEKFVGIGMLPVEPYVGAQVQFRHDYRGYLTEVTVL